MCVVVFAFAFVVFVEAVVVVVHVVGGRLTGFAVVAVVTCSALREELRVRLVDLVVGLGNLGCLFVLVGVL